MPNYKISGYAHEACDIRLMKGNEFLGYRESVGEGSYELIFELDSIENVDVIGIKSDGKIVGYGEITPTLTTDSQNITTPVVVVPIPIPYSYSITLPYNILQVSLSLGRTFDLNRSVIALAGLLSSAGNYSDANGFLYWSSSQSIIFRRSTLLRQPCIIYFTVIEYPEGIIKSVQTGYQTTSDTRDITISSVNLSKSYGSSLGGPGGGNNRWPIAWYLTSSTNIHCADSATWSGWQVVEFN